MSASSSSYISTHPRPTTPSTHKSRISPPRPFITLQPPPQSSSPPPSLPSRPIPSLPNGWRLTSHIIPAAYPRTFPSSTGTLRREDHPFRRTPAKEGESKDERNKRAEEEVIVAVEMSYDAIEGYEASLAGGERVVGNEGQKGLWIAAERWFRDDGQSGDEGVTLVCTHANGFTKESWIPTLRRLCELGPTSSTSTFGDSPQTTEKVVETDINEIWLLDDIHHGASVDLNAGSLGAVHNWVDGGRDVVNFVEHCWPGREVVDTVLEWKGSTNRRGGKRRKVIGLGHSVGGNALVQAAHARPDLFHALFLVEPMCPPSCVPRTSLSSPIKHWPAVHLTLKRRSTFPTRASAHQTTSTSPFFASWHPSSQEIWNSYSLIPIDPNDPEGPTQHSTPTWAEACVFAEPEGLGVGWDKLRELKVKVGFVMGNDPGWTMGEGNTGEMVWRAKGSVNERFMNAGHLIVQEKPDELADAVWRFIGHVMGSQGEEGGVEKAKL